MSYIFTDIELEGMRQTQTGHMMDECVVLVYAAGTANEFNEADAPSYTASSSYECGLDMNPGSERHEADLTAIQYDAVLRLPLNVSLKETDRIQITKRFGELPAPLTYEIVSPIQRGPSGVRILLRRIVV
jgi:hypothetical protein